MLRSRQSKNFLWRQTQNALVGGRSCFGHLSCNKMRSPDYFVLVAPVTKIFDGARRKSFRSVVIFASFAPVAKMILSAVTGASFEPVTTNFRLAYTCASTGSSRKNVWSRQAQKTFGRWSLVLRWRQYQKKVRSADTFVSVGRIAINFGRARRENTSDRVHSCCNSPHLQKKCGRLSLVLQSRQSQIDFCRWKLMHRSRQ